MLAALFVLVFLSLLNASALAFAAMLFFGNLGFSVSFVSLLPGAYAIYFIKDKFFSLNLTKGK